MKGNFQVRFLEGGGLATARSHSAKSDRSNPTKQFAGKPHAGLQFTRQPLEPLRPCCRAPAPIHQSINPLIHHPEALPHGGL